MTDLSYDDAPIKVRQDLAASHTRAWRRLAEPGTWWTGAERVAIAAETRNAPSCALCAARKEALSPNAVQGTHDSLGALPGPAVETIHRIRTDSGRLSKSWMDGVLADGLADTDYVETVGVVVTVIAVDTFARSIGIEPPPLPQPVDGEPSRERPAAAVVDKAWLPMIPWDDNTGAAEALYGGGFVPNVRRAMSLVPNEVRGFFDMLATQYVPVGKVGDIGIGDRAINRAQMELIAARVSALNQCLY